MDKFDFDRPRNLDAGRTVRDYDEWAFESFYGNGIAGLPRYRKSGKRVSLLDEALFRFDEHERDLSEGGIAWSFGTEYRSMLNEGLINVTDMIYKSGKMLYHVTPAKNFRHISGKGLIPRSYSKRSDYPDRIYFRMRPDENSIYDNMARELDPYINEWALLEIDLSRVPDRRYGFYRDPDSEGVYTYDNINPRCITLKRIIKT